MPKVSTSTPISTRSSKQELLDAYQELTKELENRDKTSEEPTPSTKKITNTPPDNIITTLSELRIHLNKSLTNLTETLVAEAEKVQTLRAEKETLQKQIEDLHQIKIHATTLQNLLAIKQEQQQKLETEIQQTRLTWEKEQKDHTTQTTETKKEEQKRHDRDDEEYKYLIKTTRQKEDDTYLKQKQLREETLQKREEAIEIKEKELLALQKQVADLQKQLELETTRVKKETTEHVTKDLQINYNLERKDTQTQQKLNQLTIENLQKTIKTQEEGIKDLKLEIQKAHQQIQNLAVSVIDSQRPTPTPPTPPQPTPSTAK